MCFVNGNRLAKKQRRCRLDNLTCCSFWNPLSLSFFKFSKEQEYLQDATVHWRKNDILGYIVAFIVTIRPALNFWALLSVTSRLLSLFSAFMCLALTYILLLHKELYDACRFRFIAIQRMCQLWFLFDVGKVIAPPHATPTGVLFSLIVQTPLLYSAIDSLLHRVEFRKQVILNGMSVAFIIMSIPNSCRTLSADPEIRTTFSEIGFAIDWLFSYTLLSRNPSQSEYPCWTIAASLAIVVGFILPSCWIFVSEVSSRSSFARSKVQRKLHFSLYTYTSDALRFGYLVCIASTVATWFWISFLSYITSRM